MNISAICKQIVTDLKTSENVMILAEDTDKIVQKIVVASKDSLTKSGNLKSCVWNSVNEMQAMSKINKIIIAQNETIFHDDFRTVFMNK